MDESAAFLNLVRSLVERANANQITDTADLKRCILSHDVVYGVWQDDEGPGGVGLSIIKGKGSLERIKRTTAEELAITAVRCRNAEEAEAMRQLYGDQPAQVLPLRDP